MKTKVNARKAHWLRGILSVQTRNKAMHFFSWHSVKVLCFLILFWVMCSVLGFAILIWGFEILFCVLWFCFELCDFVFDVCYSVLFFSPFNNQGRASQKLSEGLEWNRNCKNQRNLRSVLKPSCTNSNQILVFQIKLICLIFLEHLSLIKGQEFCSWRSKWLGVQYKLCEAPNDITQLAAYD